MAMELVVIRWQARGVVSERREYRDKGGATRHRIGVATTGDSIELYGAAADALFDACPGVGEECIFGGKLKREGVNNFGRTLYSLDMDLVQAPPSGARRAA